MAETATAERKLEEVKGKKAKAEVEAEVSEDPSKKDTAAAEAEARAKEEEAAEHEIETKEEQAEEDDRRLASVSPDEAVFVLSQRRQMSKPRSWPLTCQASRSTRSKSRASRAKNKMNCT